MLFKLSLSTASVFKTKLFFSVWIILSDATTEPTFQKSILLHISFFSPFF